MTFPVQFRTGRHRMVTLKEVAYYISEHLEHELEREHLAKLVDIHPNHLSRLARKHAGVTLAAYITQQRIQYAQQLLSQQVCQPRRWQRLWLPYGILFCSVFKRITGCTQGWRQQETSS